ncbi:hypothetical protein [Acinetobacter sp.]|uniref:hypothetical protein n=1 Tax=Acinetobacter sp. TaxID=472 RepID=UPI00257D2DC7|nr:hypothetical protein [Acinetobacter sp.]
MADITVKQYKAIADLKVTEGSTEWLAEAVGIFCNLTPDLVAKLTVEELERISEIVQRINDPEENNQELQSIIDYKGKRYGFHPNLSKLTVGEFADLETYCAGGFFDNINEIMGILYRPIKTEGGNFYTIEEYTGDVYPNHWDDLPMAIVLGATNFFLSIGVTLTTDLANSLVAEAKAT